MVEAAPDQAKGCHLGIDLGSMYICAAIHKDGRVLSNLFQSQCTPSVIFFEGENNHSYGHEALEKAKKQPA